jgi:archaellum biogenesis protein FlaJ (TadC family)
MNLEEYGEWIKFSRMHYPMPVWIGLSIATTIFIIIISIIISYYFLQQATLLPLAFGIASLVLMLGYPYLRKESIIDSIEYNFSDALKQMADTLKAGDTYESALREVVNSDYGRLSEEMNISLRRLEEGENIETALRGFAERIDSRLIKRTMIILLDSIKTGSSLANILDDIADDVREIYRLKEDRKASTTMQFLFMVAAGGFIAPLIFGEVSAIMKIFSQITIGALEDANLAGTTVNVFIYILIQAYLIIEVVGSGIMMSIIREGKFNKSIIYIPLLLLVAFITYYVSTYVLELLLLGAF